MPGSLLRAGLWVVTASAILVLGFAAIVFGLYGLGLENQLSLIYYFRGVVKGLLPQLLLGLTLWWGLARVFPALARTRKGLAGGLAAAAGLAYGVVAPTLLTKKFEDWPALEMTGLFQNVATFAMMTGAVVIAGLLPRLVLPPLRLDSGPTDDPR